jgi:hypothetical protein
VQFSFSASGTPKAVKAQIKRQAAAEGLDPRSARLIKAATTEVLSELTGLHKDALVIISGALDVSVQVSNPAPPDEEPPPIPARLQTPRRSAAPPPARKATPARKAAKKRGRNRR